MLTLCRSNEQHRLIIAQEHVDIATEVKKSIAADRNTTYALRNDEYPTYAIFKQSKLKIAISYRSTRQQVSE